MPSIKWFQSTEMDAPALNSPQPCQHGAGCNYMRKNKSGELEPACCAFVHPGEEGNGRRLFEQRTWYEGEEDPVIGVAPAEGGKITRVDPACVRLTGRAGYYERRRLRLSWAEWCARQGIAYSANAPGVAAPPLQIIPIGRGKLQARVYHLPAAEDKMTKSQRNRRNKKVRAEARAEAHAEAEAEHQANEEAWDKELEKATGIEEVV
jgi:hypothetical protein